MTPINTNTQNLFYSSHEHLNLSLRTPTELHKLHFDSYMCHPQITFFKEFFSGNTGDRSKCVYIYLRTPKTSVLSSQYHSTYPYEHPQKCSIFLLIYDSISSLSIIILKILLNTTKKPKNKRKCMKTRKKFKKHLVTFS
jgi:hypothetical protein